MKELVKIAVYSIVLILISLTLVHAFDANFIHSLIYWIVGYLWFIYSAMHLSYFLLIKYLRVETGLLPLVGLVMRFILTLFVMVVVLSTPIDNSILFIINFMVIYLSYVVFEIITLLSTLRKNSVQDQLNE